MKISGGALQRGNLLKIGMWGNMPERCMRWRAPSTVGLVAQRPVLAHGPFLGTEVSGSRGLDFSTTAIWLGADAEL
jgi:hypothetical protein